MFVACSQCVLITSFPASTVSCPTHEITIPNLANNALNVISSSRTLPETST
jgi:hypothetical protein